MGFTELGSTIKGNIRLGLQRLTVTDTITYYITELITTVNGLIVQALGVNVEIFLSLKFEESRLKCFPRVSFFNLSIYNM